MAQEPQTVSEAQKPAETVEALSAVDRLAIRLYRLKVGVDGPATPALVRRWNDDFKAYQRNYFRDMARRVITELALGDQGDTPASREYEVRHDEHGIHGPLDDVGDAVDFADHVWPGSKVFERSCVAVRSEWTEVTA